MSYSDCHEQPGTGGIEPHPPACSPLNTVAALLLMAILSLSSIMAQAEPPPTVYVHKDVSQKVISLGALRTIFGMRLRTWNDGSPIRVFVLPDAHPLHIAFCKRSLGIFPHQLRWAWDRLVYSGTGQAPIQVSTEEQMLRMIKTIPGAIGYLRRDPDDEDVHILEIE